MIMAKPKDPTTRKRKPVMTTLNDQRIDPPTKKDLLDLKQQTGTPLAYLLNEEADLEQTRRGPVQFGSPLIYHLETYSEKTTQQCDVSVCGNTSFPGDPPIFLAPEDLYINDVHPISVQEARELAEKTVKQSEEDAWFEARENRVTASQLSKIYIHRKKIDETFVSNILSEPKFSSKQTSFGKWNEENAKKAYCNINIACHVHDCGLIINPNLSFLGATPDGKVCDNGTTGILEIKSPYSARDMDLATAATTIPRFCLNKSDDNLTINKSHEHYIQIQGQLLVTGAPFCDYVVYTRKSTHIERVYPDLDKQQELLGKLVKFYRDYAVPFMLDDI